MISQEQIELARLNWQNASMNLRFEIITPYFIEINGIEREVFAYLPEYGSPLGTILYLTHSPYFNTDFEIIHWAKENGLYYSFLNVDVFQKYEENCFTEILDDWMKYY